MKGGGLLIPPWFEYHEPSCSDWAIVSIAFGMTLCLAIFGLIRVGIQTYHQWKRAQRITTYMVLIWLELVSSAIIGGLGWGYVRGTIRPGFLIYFFILLLWVFQIHCIMQIIVNRIALLHVSPTIVRRLKWGIFIILALINISVFCIWIPARLQISQTYIDINNIWDRIEKGLFAVIDLALNFYFVYLVRSSLISYGLTKYVVLYRFNLVMVVVSISMDILIIGSMSLRNTFLYVKNPEYCLSANRRVRYVEFHPLAYLVKLHIELSMAELIAKIVKASGPNLAPCRCTCHDNPNHTFLHQLQSRYSAPAAPSVTAPTTGRFRRSWPMSKTTRSREKRRGGSRSQTPSLTKKMVSKKQQSTEENQPKQEVWKSDTNTGTDCASHHMPSSTGQSNESSHDHND
ncbi:putative acetylxylan esterase A [Fusarium oxysporum f. sp. albedinis]|nr:putative acetylxylan esterase A [Fusarium oxysporum f. sp. albedinis]